MKKNITLLSVLFAFLSVGAVSVASAQQLKRNTSKQVSVIESVSRIEALKQTNVTNRPLFTPDANAAFYEGFENQTSFPPAGWVLIDNDQDGYNWELGEGIGGVSGRNSDNCAISYSFNNDAREALTPDNYLVTPVIEIPTTFISPIISVWVAPQDANFPQEQFQIKICTDTTLPVVAASFTTQLHDETIMWQDWKEVKVNLSNYAGQHIRIAFVHHGSSDMFAMKIDDVQVKDLPAVDLSVSNIVVREERPLTASETVKVTIHNEGRTDATNASLKLFAGETLVLTETSANPVPAFDSILYTFSQTVDLSAYGAHNLTVVVKHNEDTQDINDTTKLDFENYPMASHTWDFEAGIDENLTLHTYDENLIAAEATAQFGIEPDVAWFTLPLDSADPRFGLQIAVSLSFFGQDNENPADRWMVLPKMRLTEDNFLSYDAIALGLLMQQFVPASYEILLSTTVDEPSAYTEVLKNEESMLVAMNHIDLSAYAGQEVYIAFVNKSVGLGLVLDNIAIKGEAEILSSLEEVAQSNLSIYPNPVNDMLYINGEGVEEVVVSDLQGREVLKAQNNSIDVSALNAGMYIVKAVTSNGISTAKIIKK